MGQEALLVPEGSATPAFVSKTVLYSEKKKKKPTMQGAFLFEWSGERLGVILASTAYHHTHLQGDAAVSLAGHMFHVPHSDHQAMHHVQLDQLFSHFY